MISKSRLPGWNSLLLIAAVALMPALAGCGDSGGTTVVTRDAAPVVTEEPAEELPPSGPGSEPGHPSLVATATIEAGDETCPNGGILVQSGIDTDGNGVLDAAEVVNEESICNAVGTPGTNGTNGTDGTDGTDGMTSLTATTFLPAGDPDCPNGGTSVATGIDDDGSGVLEEVEVDSVVFVCNGSDAAQPRPMEKPEGPAPQYTINTAGGTGGTGLGGTGGNVDAGFQTVGSGGGHVKIFDTGEVDASFEIPAVQIQFGPNPLLVDADLTLISHPAAEDTAVLPNEIHTHSGATNIQEYSWSSDTDTTQNALADHAAGDDAGVAANEYHTHLDTDTTIWQRNGAGAADIDTGQVTPVTDHAAGDDSAVAEGEFHTHGGAVDIFIAVLIDTTVTSIEVAAGATLTFASNLNATSAIVNLNGHLENGGTITTELVGNDRSMLGIYASSIHGAPGSLVDMTGLDNGAGPGGNGGQLAFQAESAVMINEGIINASGGAGTGANGGTGGAINLYGVNGAYNTGDIELNGGASDDATGGAGGDIIYKTDTGPLFNSGSITANGGEGGTGTGGVGGTILIQSTTTGNVSNSGNLNASGGGGETGGGNGAATPAVQLIANGGGLVTSGDITLRGGDSDNGAGGTGGDLSIETYTNIGSWNNLTAAGDTLVSGNINTSGGNGDNGGGDGGGVEILPNPGVLPRGQELILLGYSSITTDGGDGATGGNAGSYFLYQQETSFDDGITTEGPGGAILVHVPFFGRGGAGDPDGGGIGASVDWQTGWEELGGPTEYQIIENHAPLELSGGAGATDGGGSGNIYWWGLDGLHNTGAVLSNGGAGDGAAVVGGDCNDVYLLTDGWLKNEADMLLTGGDTGGAGGTGGGGCYLELVSNNELLNTGQINISGGADLDGGSGTGGDGGNAVFLSQRDGIVDNSGTITSLGGAGDTPGSDGWLSIGASAVSGQYPVP